MVTMKADTAEEAEQRVGSVRGRHIKKRALKNKTLSVSFDEKDLQYSPSPFFFFFGLIFIGILLRLLLCC